MYLQWRLVLFLRDSFVNLVFSIVKGVQPAFGFILSKVIAVSAPANEHVLLQRDSVSFSKVFQECDLQVQEERVNLYVILFVGLGAIMLITMFLQVPFAMVSGRLTLTPCLDVSLYHLW